MRTHQQTKQHTNQLTLAPMNNMTRHNIYMHAFAQLADTFSIYEFTKLVRLLGGTQNDIEIWRTRPFLERVAIRQTTMTWSKKKVQAETKKAVEETSLQYYDFTLQEDVDKVIAILKSLGHRVMKSKTEWEEL